MLSSWWSGLSPRPQNRSTVASTIIPIQAQLSRDSPRTHGTNSRTRPLSHTPSVANRPGPSSLSAGGAGESRSGRGGGSTTVEPVGGAAIGRPTRPPPTASPAEASGPGGDPRAPAP